MTFEDDELRRSLEEFLAARAAELAKMRWYLMLKTADGCERVIPWEGRPPDVFRMPMLRTATPYVQECTADMACLDTPIRDYRLMHFDCEKGTAEYTEVVR